MSFFLFSKFGHVESQLQHVGYFVAAHGLQLWRVGLVAPRHVGISVRRPGMEPASPALQGRFLTTGPPGKSPTMRILVPLSSFYC